MFTSMEANRRNLIRVKLGYGRHKILVKRVVHEKVLVKKARYIFHLKRD